MWSGNIWTIIWIICTVQIMGLLKGACASILKRDPVMFYMSIYGVFYMTSLLPAKYFAVATINKKSWGTSGRKTLLKNYNSLIPVIVWACIVIPGVCYTVFTEIKNGQDGMPRHKIIYLTAASSGYILYWLIMCVCWKCFVQGHLHKKSDLVRDDLELGERSASSKSWAAARFTPY